MKKLILRLMILMFAGLGGANAQPPDLEIKEAWLRAVPPGSSATAAYLTLINRGDIPVELTGASAEISPDIRPMITTTKIVEGKTVHGMEFVPSLIVPAKGKIELKPGGDHLMFLQLKRVPKAGETLPVILKFGSQEWPLEIPVRRK